MREIVRKPGFLPESTWLVVRSARRRGAAGVLRHRARRARSAWVRRDPEPRHRPRTPPLRPGREPAAAVAGRISSGGRPARVSRSDRPERRRDPPLPARRIHRRQNRLQNRRGGILPVTQPIFSHTYTNGLVLVAEPIDALAVGGVHLPAAGRLRLRSGRSRGLEQLHLRDGAARRRPARQPPVRSRPRQSGRGARRVGRQRAHQLQRRHAGREPAPGVGDLRRPAAPPAPARGPVGGRPAGHAPGASGGGRRAGAEGDDGTPPAALSASRGAARLKANRRPWKRPRSTTSAATSTAAIGPTGRFSAWPAAFDWRAAEGVGGRIAGRLARRAKTAPSTRRPPAPATSTCPTIRTRRRSASPTPACPTGIPTISRPSARWAF